MDHLEDLKKSNELLIQHILGVAHGEANRIIEETKAQINENIRPTTIEIKIDGLETAKLTGIPTPHLERLVINAKLGLHSLLIGPAGCGKTMAANQVAEALKLEFGHLCFTAGASETWLFGRQTPNGFVEGIFSKLYREGGVFLADEMDAADPNLLLSINTALSSDHFLNPISGDYIRKHQDFVFIGACNTFGKGGDHIYTGRNRLDAATLDRFVSIQVEYNKDIEAEVCPDEHIRRLLQDTRDELISNQFEEVISTRAMANAYRQFQAGIGLATILDSITISWSKDAKQILVRRVATKIQKKLKKAV
jgi:MoxR-like ATPase